MTISGTAINTAIRERINGTLSTPTVRAIPVGYFSTDVPARGPNFTKAMRAIGVRSGGGAKPAVSVEHATQESPESPSGPSNIALVTLRVVTKAHYIIEPTATETDFESLRAQAVTDTDLIRQALLWPTALTVTSGAVATGIVSGILKQSGEARFEDETFTGDGGLLVVTAEYEGRVVVTQAVS